MGRSKVRYLKSLPLFKRAPHEVLEIIAAHLQELNLDKDEVLIRQDDSSHSLYIIRTGWVKIVIKSQHGEEIMINQIGPGQVIGEMSFIDQLPRSNTVVAITPITALEIDYNMVHTVLEQHPALLLAFLHEMSDRVRFANAYIGEAVEWCQQISEGNYDFVSMQLEETQETIIGAAQSNRARAGAFLSAFFKMIRSVQQREEALRSQINQLIIQVDEAKRRQAVEEITETEFFEQLQSTAQELRKKRDARRKRRRGKDDANTP